jgi:hypothetical protein
MEKSAVYETLKNFEKYTIVSVKWDRGNGPLERMVRFEGFDKQKNPLLYVTNEALLDIEKIGGYNSIISVEEECPDGACANCVEKY